MNALQQTWLTKSISELRVSKSNWSVLCWIWIGNFLFCIQNRRKNQTTIDCIYFKSDSSGRFEAGSERFFFLQHLFVNTHDCSKHRIGGTPLKKIMISFNHSWVLQNHQIWASNSTGKWSNEITILSEGGVQPATMFATTMDIIQQTWWTKSDWTNVIFSNDDGLELRFQFFFRKTQNFRSRIHSKISDLQLQSYSILFKKYQNISPQNIC